MSRWQLARVPVLASIPKLGQGGGCFSWPSWALLPVTCRDLFTPPSWPTLPDRRSGRRIVFVGCGTSYHASLATRWVLCACKLAFNWLACFGWHGFDSHRHVRDNCGGAGQPAGGLQAGVRCSLPPFELPAAGKQWRSWSTCRWPVSWPQTCWTGGAPSSETTPASLCRRWACCPWLARGLFSCG